MDTMIIKFCTAGVFKVFMCSRMLLARVLAVYSILIGPRGCYHLKRIYSLWIYIHIQYVYKF
jgi:hypothetical protein